VAGELQKKVQNILDTTLGPNKAVVQAYVTLDWTEKEITTSEYDPESAVLRSSQIITESYHTVGETAGGVPGADGNLPDGLEVDAVGAGEVDYNRMEETSNYEMTQVQTVESITPGEITNISLAVLVDGVTDPQQLASLESAVAAAAGINTDRGDVVSVESMAFDRSSYEANAIDLETTQQRNLYIQIGQYVAIGLVVIAMLWYVQRILGRLRVTSAKAWTPVLKPVSEMAGSLSAGSLNAPSSQPQFSAGSSQAFPELEASLAQMQQPQQKAPVVEQRSITDDMKSHPTIHAFSSESKPIIHKPTVEDERLQRIVERLAEEDPTNVAEVIRLWLSEG
jgi:flagellar M-ring protein FliF